MTDTRAGEPFGNPPGFCSNFVVNQAFPGLCPGHGRFKIRVPRRVRPNRDAELLLISVSGDRASVSPLHCPPFFLEGGFEYRSPEAHQAQ
jgi:hypothetical protein